MLNTPLDQWRPKFEEVGQIFGKEKQKNGSKSMMKKQANYMTKSSLKLVKQHL